MIEKEQLVEFFEGIAMKDDLEDVVTIAQIEEINRKLVARIDVQQGQLDGLQSMIGVMQVKLTQLQLQVARMEARLAEKEAELARIAAEEFKPVEQPAEEKPAEEKPAVEKPVAEEKTEVEQPIDEVKQVEEQDVVEEPVKEVPVKSQDSAAEAKDKDKAGTQTIADSIKGEESLAEKLSKRVDRETVASNINSSKIERIQTAITIADRFRFQRELFGGDAVKMAETVEKLNNMKNLDEALAFIDKSFKWDVDLQVTRDFLRLVERRFL